MEHFLTVADGGRDTIETLLEKTGEVKNQPGAYRQALSQKTLLMVFAKPSLRTRVSFETGMTQLGGHAIFYTTDESTLGKKEAVKDFSRVVSRYADAVMARLYSHDTLEEFAEYASVPVINGLTDFAHPCQAVGDLFTIQEVKGLENVTVSYVGDAANNVTHSLLQICSLLDIPIRIGCPASMQPDAAVLDEARERTTAAVTVTEKAEEAVADADVVYTDTWMSYHIPEEERVEREKALQPFQVNAALMEHTNNAVFMHCLPATRGEEVTDQVMDSDQSIIFDQAENRMHAQKALLLHMLQG